MTELTTAAGIRSLVAAGDRDSAATAAGQLIAGSFGLPVDVPLRVATEPGRQIALYELRTQPRLADVCAGPGGRYQAWYLSDPAFAAVADRRFRLNGVTYSQTPRQLLDAVTPA